LGGKNQKPHRLVGNIFAERLKSSRNTTTTTSTTSSTTTKTTTTNNTNGWQRGFAKW